MEEAAKTLDAAILNKNPKVRMEDIHLGQVVGRKYGNYVAPFFWIFYFIFHRGY